MESFLETNLHLKQSEIMDRGLKAQNDAYGMAGIAGVKAALQASGKASSLCDGAEGSSEWWAGGPEAMETFLRGLDGSRPFGDTATACFS